MTRQEILSRLPSYRDEWAIIKKDQSVKDIIGEVVTAHKEFAPLYDNIALCFDVGDTRRICKNIYTFLAENIKYKEETDDDQTTATPVGILTRGYGDCKHYASMAGGILDGINRMAGKNIDWCYRFASYRLDPTPHHVFVVVREGDAEIWIDPTPGVKTKQPIWQTDRKIKSMLRRNIAGVGDATGAEVLETFGVPNIATITDEDLNGALSDIDYSIDLPDDEVQAIALLMNYGIVDAEGNINLNVMGMLQGSLNPVDLQAVNDAYAKYLSLDGQTIGNIFDNIWSGIKKVATTIADKAKMVALAVPRNAFLGLVALNVFGYASKMKVVISDPDSKAKLFNKWLSLGGNTSNLEDTINSGAKKKAILGTVNQYSVGVAAAAAPAWLAVAAGIIAAIMPLVAQLLKNKNQAAQFSALDQTIPQQYGGVSTAGTNSITTFVQNNPLIVIGGAGLLLWVILDDKPNRKN